MMHFAPRKWTKNANAAAENKKVNLKAPHKSAERKIDGSAILVPHQILPQIHYKFDIADLELDRLGPK